ncbi:MAG TPA: hypothetical protein VFK88_01610 [Gallionella sp.]|nr:hypothetical protein [Gallionella sp.]
MMKPDPIIRATPRPIRVAYLLEDGPDSHVWLDAIFADCFGRHGGRQSLIVPIANGMIPERYKAWLQFLDPDFVLALTYDNQSLVPVLADLLAGTAIVERKRKRDEIELHPRVGVNATGLTALSWLPFIKIVSGMHRAAPELILDRYPTWTDDGFIKDNFGTLCDSVNPFPVHRQIGMRGLILTPKDAPENRWHFRAVEAVEALDGYDVIDRMSKESGIMTLGQLSNLNSQPHRPEHPWTNGFCLVVGDSFEDRISCWNAGLLFDDAQNQTFKTLRVPAAIRSDEIRTGKIANFLRQRNWIGGGNGPAKIVVRSYSLSATDVQEFVDRLRRSTMSYIDFSVIESSEECCPPENMRIFRIPQVEPATNKTTIREDTTIVSVPEPIQLGYCTGMHPIFLDGCWFVDLEIDRLNDNSRFANVREKWKVPLHPQLVKQFCPKSDARLTKHGDISVTTDINRRVIEVRQPQNENIFYGIFHDKPHFPYPDMRVHTESGITYKYSAPSDKGRYLQGMLGMLGSLNEFEEVLSNHFWRSQFESMAAPAKEQQTEVISLMQKRMKATDGNLQINDDAGWQNLAERIIQISNKLKSPRKTTSYNWLFSAWEAELRAAIDEDENLKGRRDEILAEAPDELKRSLSFLLERGVFYRGHEWSCRHCSHRNWVGVGFLKDKMPCEVCRKDHQLPVNVALDFRLNEFFATCLREHDTISVAWALSALRRESKSCFIFAPQTVLYRDYPENQGNKSDRELDVVCIIDGKFVIGEVKAEVKKIASKDIEDLALSARELGADVAILMAMSGDHGLMDNKVQQLRKLLPVEIEIRGLVSDWDDTPSCYL